MPHGSEPSGSTPLLDLPTMRVVSFVSGLAFALRYVNDSGICETTPGVHQMSGYIEVGTNMSMWFWFFEARENPESAPFTLWLNGGPGCSSMIGLFQENGPCLVNPDGESTYSYTSRAISWNNASNMIYIDQPIGTGFSYGEDTVNSTFTASPFVWNAFQVLFESGEFSKYESREFIFATESYGGHYGPAMVTYFDQQNALIDAGALQGEKVVVSALMINNGWYDPLLQNKAYVDFATYAPGYGQLQNDSVLAQLNEAFYGPGGCLVQEAACYAAGNSSASNEICATADNYCIEYVFVPAVGDRDSDDLRQNASALFPPEYYVNYLSLPSVLAAIGAESNYSECPDAPYELFTRTGDDARTLLPQLGALANSGLKMLIWAGDADINCNWLGGHASVLAMNWYGSARLHATPFTNMTIDGTPVAAVQNVDNFTFARVYASGHEVPAFQPAAALEIFTQVINKEQLHSV
ncbi:alpha/beta-hydrolase [Gloeophyllum trabeum ATCC 11539]|uniref:Alpha/beta-hydrolase n=1 Tax=Gloeophyllum trabeum (strain ATCC 11539 / FP-39264 / Madison 617) TaxID=670483 RepID=S7R8A1_GLOTA|nr:alpha/beta-hydrolase [Gloeophyllum trabeum ATCC 11539]EPQ50550.1 alpha/beta-hydrolase [Gloeophyllum trabeum ATCC 11539]